MEFTVSVDLDQLEPVTIEQLEGVAAIGGVSTGHPGGTAIGATMTVEARDAIRASAIAVKRVAELVRGGRVVRCEALTVEEFDRRNPVA